MFFPFSLHQLTHLVDKEIHRVVRQASPGKYWTFLLSRWIGKACFFAAFAIISAYVVISMVLTHAGQAQAQQIPQLADVCATLSIAAGVPAVIGSIVSEYLWNLLQPVVRRAAHTIPLADNR